MIDFSNPELQKLLAILSLLLIIPIGGYIQHRHIKKKKEEEDAMYSYPNSSQNDNSSDQEELSDKQKQIKQYILDYKSSYSKESIKQALIQAGNTEQEVSFLLEKYY